MEGTVVRPIPVSYSSAKLFEECPARFEAEKIRKVKGPKPLHMIVGIFLHEVTEAYLKHLQRTQVAHDMAYADRLFAQFWDERPSEIPEAAHEELVGLWETMKLELVMSNIDEMIEAELKLALRADWTRTEWTAEDAWLRLKIDRLEIGGNYIARIWDLKTGHKIETPEESKQGKVYGAALARAFPKVQGVRFGLYYPRVRQYKEIEFGPKDLEEGARWITGVSKRIDAAAAEGRFRPTPGPACQDCPIFYDCEKRKELSTVEIPRDSGMAGDLFERLLMVERERGDITEALKQWVENNGPVEVNGMIANYQLKERLEFPIAQLIPILNSRGVGLAKVLKADSKKLEKFARKDDALRVAVEAIKVNKSTTAFTIKRAGSDNAN